jgi:hypothetical protein
MTFCVGSKFGFYPDFKAKNATNLSDDVRTFSLPGQVNFTTGCLKKGSVFDLISCKNYGSCGFQVSCIMLTKG